MTVAIVHSCNAKSEPETNWDAPSWRQAATDYHNNRPTYPVIAPEHLSRLHRLMDTVSLARASAELNRNRATPEVTIEAVKQAVRARGVRALNEIQTQERLQRCDADARARLDCWIEKRHST